MTSKYLYAPVTALLFLTIGCGGDEPDETEEEVITTVALAFTPSGGGTALTFTFDDPDGDGGDAPTIDPIMLTAGDYTLAVTFANGLEDPPEDITAEIADEDDEHQIFLTGTAVSGPASDQAGAPLTHTYSDMDANGDPIGLANAITAAAGTGTLTLTLRHMPPVNDEAIKTSTAAADVRSGGLSAIGGSTDVGIDFDVTVQ